MYNATMYFRLSLFLQDYIMGQMQMVIVTRFLAFIFTYI